jgi:rare lipoprotein A
MPAAHQADVNDIALSARTHSKKCALRSQNVCGACPLMLRLLLLCTSLSLCGWVPVHAEHSATGVASYYNAVPKPSDKLTAAHRTLPLGTMVAVTRVDNGAQVVVRINDRGPFLKGRIIDLSKRAAEQLGMLGQGLARVRIQVVPTPQLVMTAAYDRAPAGVCVTCLLPPIVD